MCSKFGALHIVDMPHTEASEVVQPEFRFLNTLNDQSGLIPLQPPFIQFFVCRNSYPPTGRRQLPPLAGVRTCQGPQVRTGVQPRGTLIRFYTCNNNKDHHETHEQQSIDPVPCTRYTG
jgi:hypothetical protein